jgi:hypothetical protein
MDLKYKEGMKIWTGYNRLKKETVAGSCEDYMNIRPAKYASNVFKSWKAGVQRRIVCYILHLDKVKLFLYLIKHHTPKTYGGVKVWLHHSWPRRYMRMSGQLHTRPPYSRGKSTWYPLNRRLARPKCRSGYCGLEISLAPVENLTQAVPLVAYR